MTAAASPAPRPLPAGFVLAWAVFWLLMLVIAVQEHARQPLPAWWKPLLWEGSSCLVASGLLASMWRRSWTVDAWLGQPLKWFARHLRWLPLLAPAFVLAIYGLPLGLLLAGELIARHGFAVAAGLFAGMGLLGSIGAGLCWWRHLWPEAAAANGGRG